MWKSLRTKWLRICSALRTAFATDTTATSGFDTLFNDGMLLSAAVRVPTNWFGRPEHQLLGGTWNSRTYTSIFEAYIPYPNVATPTTQGSWCLYWNFDQYLFVDPADETRGWGPFGRAGIADPNTSPIGNGQGIECFYNYELTRAVRITPDLQYVVPSLRSAEPALIAGARALVSF
jgi:porin